MRILSIDFDYFVDTDSFTRLMHFPDGNDNFPPTLNKFIWDNCYNHCPSLKAIGVIEKDYTFMCDFLKNLNKGCVLFADSHREIEKFFDKVNRDDDLEVINIDYHHDMYVTGGGTLDCGNWLRHLVDLKPDTKVMWVRREDSDIESLSGSFPYYHTTDITEVQGEFDCIFICFSSPWTPPHLEDKFTDMCASLIP